MGMGMAQLGLRHALARLRGKQIELSRNREKVRQTFETAQAELTRLDAEATATAHEIELLSAALSNAFADPGTSVEPRQTFPKRHLGAWGSLTRTILDIFREANGGPLAANEVAIQVQERLEVVFDTPKRQAGFRRQIGRTLQNMRHAGYLEGLHNPTLRNEGVWRLKVTSK